MRISDWSSDVCSSDLKTQVVPAVAFAGAHRCLPLIGADEGGQAYVPAGFLAGFAQRRLLQAFVGLQVAGGLVRSEEHTSELQSLMRISYAVFCLKKKKTVHINATGCS